MTINSKLIKSSASCSAFGDWAIANKLKVAKSSTPKKGDIVLFDFNHNGTSDHVGIVTSASGNTVYTIEGNTSIDSDDNGGCVMKRTRSKSQINYFVRPKYTDKITADMIVATALAEVGVKENPKNSNKVKYNTWYYGREVKGSAYPWCMVFVSWIFAHVLTDKPTPKSTYTGAMPDFVALSGDIISNLAKKCAWPVGTAKKKYAFLTGAPFGSYKAMLNKAYPNRTKWSKRPKAGSSCDVFVGTIARASGADAKYPRGLAEQIKYSSPTLKAASNVKRGDIVRVSGHTLVVVDINGVLWEAEASYGTRGEKYSKYPAIYSKAKKSYAKVLRCNKAIRSYLKIGDTGAEVKKLQAFLNWAGYTLTVDGDFGDKTKGAVKSFQYDNGLTSDGEFGSKSLEKAKEIKR